MLNHSGAIMNLDLASEVPACAGTTKGDAGELLPSVRPHPNPLPQGEGIVLMGVRYPTGGGEATVIMVTFPN